MKTQLNPIYGLLAEFETPQRLIAAAERARDAGYRKMDGYTPYPVHGLSDAVGFAPTRLPWLVFCGGTVGALSGFFLQYWTATSDYPINIGGRPLNSWPAFIIITFECTILFSALTSVFGMLLLNGLPQPYHPLFNAPAFERASRTHFFLCIESIDPKFDLAATTEFLQSMSPSTLTAVPRAYSPAAVREHNRSAGSGAAAGSTYPAGSAYRTRTGPARSHDALP